MNRRQFLASPLAAPAVLAQGRNARPNILVLIADDLGLHTGAYGDPQAKMPNLDRVAAEGVRFTHAFCTTASCSASRSVIFTGLHNHANGQYGHAHDFHGMSLLPHVKPLPALLKPAGYRTGLVGKFHVNPAAQFGWDYLSPTQGRNVQSIAKRVQGFVESAAGSPWYLHVGYDDPHRLGRGFANELEHPGVVKNVFDPERIRVPSFLPDNAPTRREVAEYYQAANRFDQGVGMVLDMLRARGELDRTIVVIMSDNGMAFPNAKTNVYDAGSRLPFIVRAPGVRGGLVNEAMIHFPDIAPTILEWAGAKGPEYELHGRSFAGILAQENASGWDRIHVSHTFHEITMYYPIRGTRTRRFKYLRNLYPELTFPHASDLWESPTWQSVVAAGDAGRIGQRPAAQYLHRPAEELYDVIADPDEVNNLAQVPAHRETLEALRRETHAFRKRTRDPWLINDREGPFANLG
jgi:N-sulfoglucosamine sulfohydrolase